MRLLSDRLQAVNSDALLFYCPGCARHHVVKVTGSNSNAWNSDIDAPTFDHPIVIESGHYMPGRHDDSPCWCTYNESHPNQPDPNTCQRCVSTIKNGVITFSSESTHGLGGRSMPIPIFPD